MPPKRATKAKAKAKKPVAKSAKVEAEVDTNVESPEDSSDTPAPTSTSDTETSAPPEETKSTKKTKATAATKKKQGKQNGLRKGKIGSTAGVTKTSKKNVNAKKSTKGKSKKEVYWSKLLNSILSVGEEFDKIKDKVDELRAEMQIFDDDALYDLRSNALDFGEHDDLDTLGF